MFKVGDRVRRIGYDNASYCTSTTVRVGEVCTVEDFTTNGWLKLKEKPGLEYWNDPRCFELAPHKFKVGDRVDLNEESRSINNHFPPGPFEVTKLWPRRGGYVSVGLRVGASTGWSAGANELVHAREPKDKDDLDRHTTRKSRRAVLAKVLQRLDEAFEGLEATEDGRSGVPELMTQLGALAQAVLDEDREQAHEELVALTADCLAWLEDAEEQGPGEDTL